MDTELTDMEAINKLIDEVDKSNKQWRLMQESRRIEAANNEILAAYKKKAEKFDKEFDRRMSIIEGKLPGLQTSNRHSENAVVLSQTPSSGPELCVSVETNMLNKFTTDTIEVDEDSSKPELESKAYLSPVYVDRSNDDDQVSLDLVLLSDSALVEIMPKSNQTLMSAKTDMESFVAVFDYKTKHMTVNESEESLLALINSENLCVKHVRQYASEYILPVEVESSLLCRLPPWKGIKGVQRCRYVKIIDGNYVYDKGKSDMYDNEWYGAVVEENMKVKRDDDVAELENGVDSLFESFARVHSHTLRVDQIAGKIGDHAEIIQVMLKPASDVPLRWAAGETRHINLTDVGIRLPLLVYVPHKKRPDECLSLLHDYNIWCWTKGWDVALSSIRKGLALLIDNSSQVLPTEFYGKFTLDMRPYAVIDEIMTLEEYFYRPRTYDIGDRVFLELLLPNEQTVLKGVRVFIFFTEPIKLIYDIISSATAAGGTSSANSGVTIDPTYKFLIDRVTMGVVTVHACFNIFHREAIKDARRIAGLEVIGSIDEHTVIFMEYEFEKKNSGAILVFDPGGGTLNVSVHKEFVRKLNGRDSNANVDVGAIVQNFVV